MNTHLQGVLFNHVPARTTMTFTRQVTPLVRPDEKIHHLTISEEGTYLAWSEGKSKVLLAAIMEDNTLETIKVIDHSQTVSALHFHRSQLIIADEIEGFSIHGLDGELLEHQPVDAGVQACYSWGIRIVILDGMGSVLLGQYQRPLESLTQRHRLGDCSMLHVAKNHLYIVQHNGSIVAVNESDLLWTRPQRGDIGERITSVGTTLHGSFFLTREGHALVAGEEEAIEFELWSGDQLIQRSDLRMRMLTSNHHPLGAVLGFDNGQVFCLQEDGQMELIMDTGHPVISLLHHQGQIMAASWFYIHGNDDGVIWKVEHQGMPSHLALREQDSTLFFAGEDQNDYTDAEPIGRLLLRSELIEVDQTELSLWFEHTPETEHVSADVLYAKDQSEVYAHLTQNERDAMDQDDREDDNLAFLLAAMEEQVSESSNKSSFESAEQLFDELTNDSTTDDDEIHDMILNSMAAPVQDVHRPQALAGDDQRHVADEQGTAIVLLDARGTSDPHNQIVSWAWLDDRGQELASSPQLKLKLPVGAHRFELRVVDKEGAWTTDQLTVNIIQGSTS